MKSAPAKQAAQDKPPAPAPDAGMSRQKPTYGGSASTSKSPEAETARGSQKAPQVRSMPVACTIHRHELRCMMPCCVTSQGLLKLPAVW